MLISIDLPPGFYFNGTDRESQGRYRTGDLVRWYGPSLQPVGGWRSRSVSLVTGVARAALTWSANDSTAWIGIGTHTKLFVMTRSGGLSDVTPVAIAATGTITVSGTPVAAETFVVGAQTFTFRAARAVAGEVTISAVNATQATNIVTAITADLATVTAAAVSGVVTVTAATPGTAGNSIVLTEAATGIAVSGSGFLTGGATALVAGAQNAVAGGGYGTGLYGTGLYGTVRADSTSLIPASQWTLDTFGQNLVGVLDSDQRIYEWTLNPAVVAARVANSPLANAIVTTQEGILMALGTATAAAPTLINPRYIRWSGLQNNTDWTPTSVNQSRDALLQTQGKIMTAKRVPGGVLVMTDEGAFLGTYVGLPFVYTFQRVGSGCGIASRQAIAVTQASTYWMGKNGFFQYNGFTSPLSCDVQDYVFSDINVAQMSKVSAVLNSDFSEVWWFYPSGASLEIDRYVAYNYLENIWYYGTLARTCGTGSNGVLQYPIMVGTTGAVFDHEVDNFRDGRTATARTGPVEIGKGDNVIMLNRYIPDEKTAGAVDVNFYAKDWPNLSQTTYGPYDSTSPTDLRIPARQLEIEYVIQADMDARVGRFRFDARPGGKR